MATDSSILDRLPDRSGVTFSAVYGAVVTVLLSFLPFSSVLGGAVAATRYDRTGYPRGAGVGLLSGLFAALPLAALFVPALAIAGALGFGVDPASPAYDVFLTIVVVFFLAYTVGLGALGGLVGVWVGTNTEWSVDPVTWV